MATLKRKKPQANYWFTGIIFSIVLLAIFLYLQEHDTKMLNLEIKWLVVASIPLLLAILRSNIIQKFKGFGIELETRLQEPIGKIDLVAINALSYLPGDDKQSIYYLQGLPENKRLQIKRLTFQEGRQNYYNIEVVQAYMLSLPNLIFIEVVNNEGQFIALIPVEIFRFNDQIDMTRLGSFLKHLVEKETVRFLSHTIITEKISEKENLVNALPLVRRSKHSLLPVVSDDGYLRGIITAGMIESKIADEVLAAQQQG